MTLSAGVLKKKRFNNGFPFLYQKKFSVYHNRLGESVFPEIFMTEN